MEDLKWLLKKYGILLAVLLLVMVLICIMYNRQKEQEYIKETDSRDEIEPRKTESDELSEEERAPYERLSNEEDAFIKAIHGDKEQPIEEDQPTVKIVQKRKPSGIYMTMNLPLVRKEFPSISFG